MTVSVERFLAFTDAYLAIIATLMVTALVHLEEDTVDSIKDADDSEHKLADELYHRVLGVAVYFVTFNFISRHFLAHAKAMTSIPRVKLGTIATHIFGYFPAITFLPSSTSFLATYFTQNAYISVAFFGNLILLTVASGLIDYTLIKDSDCRLIVFSRTVMHVGHPDVLDKIEQKGYAMTYSTSVRYTVFKVLGTALSLAISMAVTVAVGVSSSPGEWYLYPFYAAMGVVHTFADMLIISMRFPSISAVGKEVKNRAAPGLGRMGTKRKTSLFDKSRLEAFADGVFGIVATLIVLEIKPTAVTSKDSENLSDYVNEHIAEIISAVVALLLTVSLWNIHATIVSLLEKSGDDVTLWTFRANGALFSWVCLVPFSTSLVAGFPRLALPPLILGLVFLFITVWFSVFLFLVTRRFRKSKQQQQDWSHGVNSNPVLLNDGDTTTPEEESEPSDVDVVHFRNIANQAKIKLFFFGVEAFTLIILGIWRFQKGAANHDYVITSIMLTLLFCLALEMGLETTPYFKQYVEDDLEKLRPVAKDNECEVEMVEKSSKEKEASES